MIQRGMKSEIADRGSGSQRHTEGLNRAIKVLVIDRIFIMPNASNWTRHLVGDERTAIDSRNGLDRVDGSPRPGIDGWDHSHRGSDRRKSETRNAANRKAPVRR